MGAALITDVGVVSDPGAAESAVIAAPGSSFTVRNFSTNDTAELVELTRKGATAGIVRVRSPKLSDNLQGIRYAVGVGEQSFLLQRELLQGLYPQDPLTVEVTGGATEYDGAAISTYYDNLPGISQRLHMPGDFSSITKFVDSWQVTVDAGATVGNWGTALINSFYNVIPNNTDIAVLGYVVDAACLAVAINGVATGNEYLGGPGDTSAYRTRNYFADLSKDIGKPCVPVLNTGDSSAINIAVSDVAASTAVNVTLVVAILNQLVTP